MWTCQPLQRQASEPHPPSTPGCPSASSSHLCDTSGHAGVSTHPDGLPSAAVGTQAQTLADTSPVAHYLKSALCPSASFSSQDPYSAGRGGRVRVPAPCTHRPQASLPLKRWEGKPSTVHYPLSIGSCLQNAHQHFEKNKPARGYVKMCVHEGIVPQYDANYRVVWGPRSELAL